MEDHNHLSGISPEALLRHWLLALKYRFTNAISGASEDFASFNAGSGVRSPIELLSHMSHVMGNAYSIITASPRVHSEIGTWDEELIRFYEIIEKLDQTIVNALPERSVVEKIVQGPLTDAISHVGQLTMLRRLAGIPVDSVNFFQVNIKSGD